MNIWTLNRRINGVFYHHKKAYCFLQIPEGKREKHVQFSARSLGISVCVNEHYVVCSLLAMGFCGWVRSTDKHAAAAPWTEPVRRGDNNVLFWSLWSLQMLLYASKYNLYPSYLGEGSLRCCSSCRFDPFPSISSFLSL